MSEVKRYSLYTSHVAGGTTFIESTEQLRKDFPQAKVYIEASYYDTAQSELAALRERHDTVKCQRNDAQQRLTAAEQRNAELVELLRESDDLMYAVTADDLFCALGEKYGNEWVSVITALRSRVCTAINPTESGAGDETAAWDASNPFWPCDNAEDLAEFKAWQALKRTGESGASE